MHLYIFYQDRQRLVRENISLLIFLKVHRIVNAQYVNKYQINNALHRKKSKP